MDERTLLSELDLHCVVRDCCGHEKTVDDLCGNCYQIQASIESYRQRIAELEAENAALRATLERVKGTLWVLTALVRGECPSLLDRDSGGNVNRAIGDIHRATLFNRSLIDAAFRPLPRLTDKECRELSKISNLSYDTIRNFYPAPDPLAEEKAE